MYSAGKIATAYLALYTMWARTFDRQPDLSSEFFPKLSTAPRNPYLADLRYKSPDDPRTVNYGALRVDRRCFKLVEALYQYIDEPWFLKTMNDAMAGRHDNTPRGPLQITCPIGHPGANFQPISDILEFHVVKDRNCLAIDSEGQPFSLHAMLYHEFRHAFQFKKYPSVHSFLMFMPSASRWPNWLEHETFANADIPYAKRFGLAPPQEYSMFTVLARNWPMKDADLSRYLLARRKRDNTPIDFAQRLLSNAWNPEALVHNVFDSLATPHLPIAMVDHIISFLYQVRTIARDIALGKAEPQDLNLFTESAKIIIQRLQKYDEMPLTHGCREAEHESENTLYQVSPLRRQRDHFISVATGCTPPQEYWHIAKFFALQAKGPRIYQSKASDLMYLTLQSQDHRQLHVVEHLAFATEVDIHEAIQNAITRIKLDGKTNISLILEANDTGLPTSKILQIAKHICKKQGISPIDTIAAFRMHTFEFFRLRP